MSKSEDQNKARRDSSARETPGIALDESPDLHQGQLSSIDNQPSSSTTTTSSSPSEDAQGRIASASDSKTSEESSSTSDEGTIESKSTLQTELVDYPIYLPVSIFGKRTISQSGEGPKTTNGNTNTVATKWHPLAQSDDALPNVKQMEQTKQKGSDQKNQVSTPEQKMDFGPLTQLKVILNKIYLSNLYKW